MAHMQHIKCVRCGKIVNTRYPDQDMEDMTELGWICEECFNKENNSNPGMPSNNEEWNKEVSLSLGEVE